MSSRIKKRTEGFIQLLDHLLKFDGKDLKATEASRVTRRKTHTHTHAGEAKLPLEPSAATAAHQDLDDENGVKVLLSTLRAENLFRLERKNFLLE